MSSPNAITWTPGTAVSTTHWRDVVYGTGLTGGWQRGWESWPNEGKVGWACIRAIFTSGPPVDRQIPGVIEHADPLCAA